MLFCLNETQSIVFSAKCAMARLAVDMKFPIHIHIH